MVLPESPLLTFSFALRALSFSHVLTCSAPRPHSPAQYGVSAPFTSTHASTRRGMEEMSRFSTAPRLLFSHRTAFRTRTRKAFSLSHAAGFVLAKRKFNSAHASQAARMAPATRGTKPLPPLWTAAGGRGVHEHVRKVASHMLRTPSATRFVDGCTLDTARPEGPGAATLHGVFMGFSRGFLGVFTGFLRGFHGVSRGVTKCCEFIHKMTLLGGPRGPQGHRPV